MSGENPKPERSTSGLEKTDQQKKDAQTRAWTGASQAGAAAGQEKNPANKPQESGDLPRLDGATPPPGIDNLDKSIPAGELETRPAAPPEKALELPPHEAKAPPEAFGKEPGGKADQPGQAEDPEKPALMEFEPEVFHLSDSKLSPREAAERKSVARPQGGVGHYFGSDLPTEGHLDAWEKNDLTPEQRNALKSRDGKTRIILYSFASRPDSDRSNQELTDRRGKNIAEQITRRYGIPPGNIEVQSFGEQIARENGTPAGRDNRFDRVTLIEVIPADEPGKGEGIKIDENDPRRIAGRLLEDFPAPPENKWKEHAWETFSNLLPGVLDLRPGPSIEVDPLGFVINFGISGFKHWLGASSQARENFQASSNFIPAFLDETVRLTTGKAQSHAMQPGSADAVLGRLAARTHYLQLTDLERKKLTGLMKDEGQRKEFLTQVEDGLRDRFIAK